MTQVDRMADLIRDTNAGRLAATLDRLTAEGHLTPDERARLAADDAFGTLERLLRTAELAGHHPEQVLTAAVTARTLDSATSPAQVLHYRIAKRLEGRLTPRIHDSAADLIPHHLRDDATAATRCPADQQRAALLHAYADAADNRRHELGARTAADPPAWALDALGPVPTGDTGEAVIARQEWEHRAGWAAAYRELVGHTDEHDALGTAPGAGRVEHRMLYRAAHEALDLPEAGDEEAGMTTGRLRCRAAAYERERAWAPRWVEDELAATHERHQRLTADATVWDAHADATDTTADDAAQLRADAAKAREEAAPLAEQIADLERVDHAWAQWYTDTAVTRDLAERSRHELRSRGVDIDNAPDRATAAEWLDAHHAAQADEERYAAITGDDILDDDLTASRAGGDDRTRIDDSWPADTGVPDIRQTAVADPTETADPAVRRRVLTLVESAQAVAKAQAALVEIAARREVDAAREAEDEAARRDQLNRWAADEATPTVADDRADEATTDTAYADAPVLER
jgi:hypothetical protein